MVRQGRWWRPEALDDLWETARRHDPERTQRNVYSGLAAQGVDVSALLR